MSHSLLRYGHLAGVLALVSAVTLTACGGGKDPILGLGTEPALVPSVSATAPLARQPAVTGVATNTQLAATFNKPMDPATLNTGTVLLACPSALPVAGTVTYEPNSRVVSFVPLGLLPASTLCVATVTTGAQDALGVPMSSDFVWSFETAASADTQAPLVTGFVPALNAVAATNAQITVSFNEDMAPLSLNTSSLMLNTTVGNLPVAGTVSYAVGARTATFTPTNPALLPANTDFTATVSTLATDLAGNPLAANTVWTFSTANALDSTAPLVSLVPLASRTLPYSVLTGRPARRVPKPPVRPTNKPLLPRPSVEDTVPVSLLNEVDTWNTAFRPPPRSSAPDRVQLLVPLRLAVMRVASPEKRFSMPTSTVPDRVTVDCAKEALVAATAARAIRVFFMEGFSKG